MNPPNNLPGPREAGSGRAPALVPSGAIMPAAQNPAAVSSRPAPRSPGAPESQ